MQEKLTKTVVYSGKEYYVEVITYLDNTKDITINHGEYRIAGNLDKYGNDLIEIVTNVIKDMNTPDITVTKYVADFMEWDGVIK